MTNPGSGNRSLEGYPEEIPAKVQHSGDLGLEQPTRQFNTPLHEAVDRNLVGPVPDSPAALVEPDDKKNERGFWTKTKVAVAGVTAAALTAVGVGVASSSGEGAPAKDPSSTSASAETGETQPQEVNLTGVDTYPSDEQLQLALQPVSANLTPAQAVIDLTERINVFYNSGVIDENNFSLENVQETQESMSQGDALQAVIFDEGSLSSELQSNYAGFDITRTGVASLRYSLTAYSQELQFSFSATPGEIKQVQDAEAPTFEVPASFTAKTNLDELVESGNLPAGVANSPTWDNLDDTGDGVYTITQVDGSWKVINITKA